MRLPSAVVRKVNRFLRNMTVNDIAKRPLLVLALPSPDALPRQIGKPKLVLLLLLLIVLH